MGAVTGEAKDAFSKTFGGVIPDGTMALARIDSFYNAEHEGMRTINIDWELVDGEFVGRKITQKLKVIDADPRDRNPEKTRHRCLNMMMLIYKMFNVKPQSNAVPTDAELSVFSGKRAGIKIQETQPNDEGKVYNYISEVHSENGFKCETGVSHAVVHVRPNVESAFSRNQSANSTLGDDLPF
ncbi:MAG: hypothetical protein AB7F29_13735 [Candidatus Nitrosocosmicus sp.]